MATDDVGTEALAGLIRRLAAFAVDALLLFVLVIVSQALLLLLDSHPFGEAFAGGKKPVPTALHFWVAASTTMPFAAYFAACFASRAGATFGQRLAKIAVHSPQAGPLSAGRAILRALVLLIPFELNHALMFHASPWTGRPANWFGFGLAALWLLCALYVLLPLLRRDRRSLHDLAAGSLVVRT